MPLSRLAVPALVVIPVQIVVEDLVVERGSRAVIDGLSFKAAGGQALVLQGANGAGKTTLLRALAGFLRPVRGSIRLEGGDAEMSLAEQAHVVGHANAVKSNLTVAENVSFWSAFLGETVQSSDESTARALSHFGLSGLAEFPAGYLSAGQKRRLGLARLLAAERPIWLLDEPTVSLDASSVALLADAVNAHTKSGGIAIAATHLPLGLVNARELRLQVLERVS